MTIRLFSDLSILGVGCQVNIGVVRPNVVEDRVIKIVRYFGFNPSVLVDFWIYVESDELTLLKIAKAFKMEQHIPQIFHNQGFPEGFTFSSAKEDEKSPQMSLLKKCLCSEFF